MNLNLILLDFDGTIADTFTETVKIFNCFADKYGYNRIKDEEIEKARCMNVWQLLKFVKFPKRRLPSLLRKGRATLYKNLDKVEVFEGVVEILSLADKYEIPCGIITSNSRKNVERFIQLNELPNIHFVRSSSRLLGKPREFKRVLKKRKLTKESVIYIGDETRDIEAAHESGIRIAAVTWGYNSKTALSDHKPDYLIDDPQALLTILEKQMQNGTGAAAQITS